MKRLAILCVIGVTVLAGCSSSPPQVCPGPIDCCGTSNELDYSTWPAVTPKPINVPPDVFADCRADRPERSDRGPHISPAIKVYANPVAHKALLSGDNKPMPVGAVVVKEKLDDEKATKPHAYGAMIKREPGYDPENGDWEYVFVTLGEKGSSERGKIATCIGCHSSQSAKDYLFRAYIDRPTPQK